MPGHIVDPRFSRRLREILHERGLSYGALAARVHYSRSYLCEIAKGTKTPTVDLARRLDMALDTGGELAGYVHSTHHGRAIMGQTGDMLRRNVLLALTRLGAGHILDRLAVSELLAGLAQNAPGGTTLDDWHEAVWEYGQTYLTAPRHELLADLTADLATVTSTAQQTTEANLSAGFHEVAARLAGLAAMVCTDLGYAREARHAWRVARRLADASGSTAVRLWVRGQEAILGLYCGRPVPLVLELADQGLAIEGPPAGGWAHLHSARAQALAVLGRTNDAIRALDSVGAAFDQLPDATRNLTTSIFGWPEQRLRHTESFVHSIVGRTADAYQAQDRALAMYSPTQMISSSQVQMHRAACLVRDGDIAGGIDHAVTTLDRLPGYARGNFVLTVADAVLGAVPALTRSDMKVIEYSDILASMRREGSR